jgi:hypothetical protein
MTSHVWITLKTRRLLTVAFSLASCLPVLQLSTCDSRIQWFGKLVVSDLLLPWASTAEINDRLYFGPRLLAHQLILDTFVAYTSNVSSISCDVHAQRYEHSHSYKPQSRTCRYNICHFYLQCMIDLLQLIFSYKQLHQILMLLSSEPSIVDCVWKRHKSFLTMSVLHCQPCKLEYCAIDYST